MSVGPNVATATVRIIPDTTGFRAELQRQVAIATKGVTASVQAQVAGTAAAANAAAVSGVRGGAGGSAARSAGGIRALTNESNALRGTLIGLSRVTPVTVFGLGVYGTAAIAAGYAIKGALRSTADFEHQLYVLQATTGATNIQMKQIADLAKQLGADLSLPSTSAGDAARAMTELAKAGLSVEDTMAGARGVLQLAAAANIDVGTSANFVATELNAYELAGSQATHVADLLAGASKAAQGEITDFGTAFQQVSAVAHTAGISLEQTTGLLVEFAKAGLKGADGGTSLRTMLLRLTPTTKQAAEYQKALGIQLDQTKTIGQQLPEILDKYQSALKGVNPLLQQQALTQIFGQDAYRGATIAIKGGSAALEENTRKADEAGAAAALAAANAKGLSGAVNGLKSSADTLGITVGNFVKGPLEGLVRGLSDTVGMAGDATTALDKFAHKLDSIKIPSWLGGGKGKKQQTLGDALKNVTKEALFLGPETYQAVKRAIEKGRRTAKEEMLHAQGLQQQIAAGQFGINSLYGKQGYINRGVVAPATPDLTAAELAHAAVIEARIRAQQRLTKKKMIRPADTTAPRNLQIEQLNAQLADDLKAELDADKKIENYFHERLKLAVKGTLRYKNILAAEAQAHSTTASVQSQINQNAKAAAAATKAANDERKRQAEKDKRDAAAQAAAIFNLEKSRLDLRIAAAGLTKPTSDDVRWNRAEIRWYNAQIKRIEAIRKRRKLTLEEKQAVVDYRTAIISLRSTILGLKDQASSGFSLNDLFKEAANQFGQFASNVSSSPTSLGGARGAVAAGILAQKKGLTEADLRKLNEAATTNELLAKILDAINGVDQPSASINHNPFHHTKPGLGSTGVARALGSVGVVN